MDSFVILAPMLTVITALVIVMGVFLSGAWLLRFIGLSGEVVESYRLSPPPSPLQAKADRSLAQAAAARRRALAPGYHEAAAAHQLWCSILEMASMIDDPIAIALRDDANHQRERLEQLLGPLAEGQGAEAIVPIRQHLEVIAARLEVRLPPQRGRRRQLILLAMLVIFIALWAVILLTWAPAEP